VNLNPVRATASGKPFSISSLTASSSVSASYWLSNRVRQQPGNVIEHLPDTERFPAAVFGDCIVQVEDIDALET
jgi:hypothetical protein